MMAMTTAAVAAVVGWDRNETRVLQVRSLQNGILLLREMETRGVSVLHVKAPADRGRGRGLRRILCDDELRSRRAHIPLVLS
jgi:hypothetical protein